MYHIRLCYWHCVIEWWRETASRASTWFNIFSGYTNICFPTCASLLIGWKYCWFSIQNM